MNRSRRGFTLVELLVVIGIIALLISILLPSLARARQSAVTLQCLSNIRSIGQTLMMYSNDNKGYYPYGWAFVQNNGDGDQRYWANTLAGYMQGGNMSPWDDKVNSRMAIFRCPDVTTPFSFTWTPATHYGSHPIIFPTALWASPAIPVFEQDWKDSANVTHTGMKIGPYKSSWMAKNGSDKVLIWDAVINTDPADVWGGSAFPGTCNVDSDRLWWGSGLLDAPGIWPSWHNINEQVGLNYVFQDKPGNAANGGSGESFRVRHNNNTACNFLFGDGHAETRTFSRSGLSRDTGRSDMTHANFAAPVGYTVIRPSGW